MEQQNFRLYAVYLGGELLPGRMGEDHEVVFVVANGLDQARQAAKAKWAGHDKAHVDAVQMLDVIDGHAIRLEVTGEGDRAFIDSTYVAADGT